MPLSPPLPPSLAAALCGIAARARGTVLAAVGIVAARAAGAALEMARWRGAVGGAARQRAGVDVAAGAADPRLARRLAAFAWLAVAPFGARGGDGDESDLGRVQAHAVGRLPGAVERAAVEVHELEHDVAGADHQRSLRGTRDSGRVRARAVPGPDLVAAEHPRAVVRRPVERQAAAVGADGGVDVASLAAREVIACWIDCTGCVRVPGFPSFPAGAAKTALRGSPSMPSQLRSSNARSGSSVAPGLTAGSSGAQSPAT